MMMAKKETVKRSMDKIVCRLHEVNHNDELPKKTYRRSKLRRIFKIILVLIYTECNSNVQNVAIMGVDWTLLRRFVEILRMGR